MGGLPRWAVGGVRFVALLVLVGIGAVGTFGGSVGAADAPATSPQAPSSPQLEFRSIQVSPQYARPGEVVRVEAIVVNGGTAPATNVQLVPAVSGGAFGSIAWEVVDLSGAGPIPGLAAGQAVTLAASVRVLEEGTPKIGAAVTAPSRRTRPGCRRPDRTSGSSRRRRSYSRR